MKIPEFCFCRINKMFKVLCWLDATCSLTSLRRCLTERLFHGCSVFWWRGFSSLIRNSFCTACYYLWPLDVWIDLQALGPGHCVGHVWRRSRPLCVVRGPWISCPSPKYAHTHWTACPTHYLHPMDKSSQNTLMLCRIAGITEQMQEASFPTQAWWMYLWRRWPLSNIWTLLKEIQSETSATWLYIVIVKTSLNSLFSL